MTPNLDFRVTIFFNVYNNSKMDRGQTDTPSTPTFRFSIAERDKNGNLA